MLCSHRFPLPGSPTTCQLDTSIVPLPSFLLIAALATWYCLQRRSSRFSGRKGSSEHSLPGKGLSLFPRWLYITYVVLVAATFFMTILEIVRLVLDKQGVGLLPVPSIALLVASFVLWINRTRTTRSLALIFAVYWLFYGVVEAVKCARLHQLLDLDPHKESKYPSSDWLLDNLVMMGLYFLFMCFEVAILATDMLLRRQVRSSYA